MTNLKPSPNGQPQINDDTGENVAAAAAAVSIVLISPVSLVLVPLAVSDASEAAEIRRNFSAKALHEETISPGDLKDGFVYFELPEHAPAQVGLRVRLLNPTTNTMLSFDYVVDTVRR